MADCICELLCKLKSMINQYDWASKWAVVSPQKIAFKEFETGRAINFLDLNRMGCLLYTSPSPRDRTRSRMPSSA